MITGELKNKIDSLWDIFATGGLVNPLDVIEQITYLMFIHDLDDSDNLRAKEAAMLGLPYQSIFADEVQLGERTIDGQQLKWSVFHDFPAQKMYATMREHPFLHDYIHSVCRKVPENRPFQLCPVNHCIPNLHLICKDTLIRKSKHGTFLCSLIIRIIQITNKHQICNLFYYAKWFYTATRCKNIPQPIYLVL